MAKPDLNELVDTKVEEMSLVPQGANEKKKFLILKSDNDTGEQDMSERSWEEILKELTDHPDGPGLTEKPEEVEALIKELSPKEQSTIKGALRLLGTVKGAAGEKIVRSLNAMLGFGNPEKEVEKPKPNEEEKDVKKEETPEDDLKKEDLPVAVQKALDDSKAEIETLKKEKNELSETVLKEQQIRKRAEFVVVAKENYSHLSKTPEELADIMLKIDPALAKDIDAILSAADKQVEASELFKEIGNDAPGETSAEGKILSLAKELQAKDPKLTEEQAYSKVMLDNPDLYAKFESEVN